MSVKINELATKPLESSSLFASADANGIAYKNTLLEIQSYLSVADSLSFKGDLTIAEAAVISADGWYFATETGDYIVGGVTTAVSVTNNLVVLIISDSATTAVLNKVDIPLSITIDAIPTIGSTNAVQSGGTADALLLKLDKTDVASDGADFKDSDSLFKGKEIFNKFTSQGYISNLAELDTIRNGFLGHSDILTVNGEDYTDCTIQVKKDIISYKCRQVVKGKIANGTYVYISRQASNSLNWLGWEVQKTFESVQVAINKTKSESNESSVSAINNNLAKSQSELINTFDNGNLIDQTNWVETNATITDLTGSFNATFNVTTGSSSYLRYFGASKVDPNRRYAILSDYSGVSAEFIDVLVALRDGSSAYMADTVVLDKVKTGEQNIDVKFFNIFNTVSAQTNANIWLQANSNSITESFKFENFLLIDLGLEGDVFYNYTKEQLIELYSQFGFQLNYVISRYSKYSVNSDRSVFSEKLLTKEGKKLVVIGDSNVWQEKFQQLLVDKLGMTYSSAETKLGTATIPPMGSGGTIIRPYYNNDIVYSYPYIASPGAARYSSIHHRSKFVKLLNPNVIILLGGQNDGALSGAALGSITDETYLGDEVDYRVVGEAGTPSFYSSYKGVLQILSRDNPNAEIYVGTTLQNWYYVPSEDQRGRYEVLTAIKECAALYGIKVLNLYEELGVNEFNAGISDDGNGDSQEIYYQKDSLDADWIANGSARVHFTAKLAEKIADFITNKIR